MNESIFLPIMIAYRKYLDETKYMSFLIEDDESLEIYNEIWGKLSNNTKKNFVLNLHTMGK